MALTILDYDGAVDPISGTNPYGQIKNRPLGTRINVKSNGDMQVFFQRLMGRYGVTANSLPENTVNGFQLHEALGLGINQQSSALAESVGAGTGVTIGVKAAGMQSSIVGPNLVITAGWFYYWGLFGYCPGATVSTTGSQQVTITLEDGFPVGTVTTIGGSVTPDATHFDYNDMVDHPLITSPYTNITVTGTGWTSVGGLSVPRYAKKGNQIFMDGQVVVTGATSGPLFTIPYAPAQAQLRQATLYTGTGSAFASIAMAIASGGGGGQVSVQDAATSPSTPGAYVDISSLGFIID